MGVGQDRMKKDKNGHTVKIGDMLRFPIDRYTYELGIVTNLYDGIATLIEVKVCGGGGKGNRYIVPGKGEVIETLDA